MTHKETIKSWFYLTDLKYLKVARADLKTLRIDSPEKVDLLSDEEAEFLCKLESGEIESQEIDLSKL